MTEILADKIYTEQEYFDLELADPLTKYEFHNGNIFAMSGGTLNHGIIASNLIHNFRLQLKKQSKSCKVLGSDVKVKLTTSNAFFYPDVFVICNKIKNRNANLQVVSNPTLIIEVLSSSTSNYDRTTKFKQYRTLPSLKEYALVYQDENIVETYIQRAENQWAITIHEGLNAMINFDSLGISVSMQDIYEDVVF